MPDPLDLRAAAQALLDEVLEAMEIVAPRSGADPQDLPGEDVYELVVGMHDFLRKVLIPAPPSLRAAGQAMLDAYDLAVDPATRIDDRDLAAAHRAEQSAASALRSALAAEDPPAASTDVVRCWVCKERPEDGITGLCDVCGEDESPEGIFIARDPEAPEPPAERPPGPHDHDAQLAHLVDEWGLLGVVMKLLTPLTDDRALRVLDAARARVVNLTTERLEGSTGDPVWCAKHREGWCAISGNEEPAEGAGVETLCGYAIPFPAGFDHRRPTCDGCLTLEASLAAHGPMPAPQETPSG